jgi:predicted nucleic acid-binding protein
MGVVVDASVAMGWLVQSQTSDLAVSVEDHIRTDDGWIPLHFGIEIARSLRRLERRGLLTPEFVDGALARLRRYPLRQDISDKFSNIEAIVGLARRHTLRVADAAYLELALRTDLPLATRDNALAAAAANAGAALFKP